MLPHTRRAVPKTGHTKANDREVSEKSFWEQTKTRLLPLQQLCVPRSPKTTSGRGQSQKSKTIVTQPSAESLCSTDAPKS